MMKVALTASLVGGLISILSPLQASAALQLKEGNYKLVKDTYGICTDDLQIFTDSSSFGTNAIFAGSWFFSHIGDGPVEFDESEYKSTTTCTEQDNAVLKIRSVYSKATGVTATQSTKFTVNGDVIRVQDRDIAIPATTVDCTYRFVDER